MPALTLVKSTSAGEVYIQQTVPTVLDTWSSHIYRGRRLLEIPKRQWTIKGWLPQDSIIAVYAPPGVGKSFYALTLALEMANGGEWIGRSIPPVNVLYVAAERGTELRDRAEAWSLFHDEDLPESFVLIDVPQTPQLMEPKQVEALCELIKNESVKFVVLDTFARMTEGIEENSSKDIGVVVRAIDQLRQATGGGTVMVVHHTGKNAGAGLRGSSALLGALDLTIEISASGSNLETNVRKSNSGPTPMPEWFKITSFDLPSLDGEWEPRSVGVLEYTGAPAKSPEHEAMVLEILDEFESLGASKKEIIEALIERGVNVTAGYVYRTILAPLLKREILRTSGKTNKLKWHRA
jgi:hypothetical protein